MAALFQYQRLAKPTHVESDFPGHSFAPVIPVEVIRRIRRYSETQYVQSLDLTGAGVGQLDQWWRPAAEPLRPRRPINPNGHSVWVSEPQFSFDPGTAGEWQYRSPPIFYPRQSAPAFGYAGFMAHAGYFAEPASSLAATWLRQQPTPTRRRHQVDPGQSIFRIEDSLLGGLVSAWYVQPSEPVRARPPRRHGGEQAPLGPDPSSIASGLSSTWWVQQPDPVRRVVQRPQGMASLDFEAPRFTAGVAEWYIRPPDPVRRVARFTESMWTAKAPHSGSSTDLPVEITWFARIPDPPRRAPQVRLGLFVFPEATVSTELGSVASWYAQPPLPPRRIRRVEPGWFVTSPRSGNPSTLTFGRTSYWKCDEASGSMIDSVGPNSATDVNTVTTTTGKLNGARQFTAASLQQQTVVDNASISIGDVDMTWSFWVKFDTLSAQDIISKVESGAPFHTEYGFALNGSNRIILRVRSTDGSVDASTPNTGTILTTGTFYHVRGWHDSTLNTINISIDGGAASTTSHSGGIKDSNGTLRFGAHSGGNFLNGALDEIAFYKRLLTDLEAVEIRGNGTPPDYLAGGESAFRDQPIEVVWYAECPPPMRRPRTPVDYPSATVVDVTAAGSISVASWLRQPTLPVRARPASPVPSGAVAPLDQTQLENNLSGWYRPASTPVWTRPRRPEGMSVLQVDRLGTGASPVSEWMAQSPRHPGVRLRNPTGGTFYVTPAVSFTTMTGQVIVSAVAVYRPGPQAVVVHQEG